MYRTMTSHLDPTSTAPNAPHTRVLGITAAGWLLLAAVAANGTAHASGGPYVVDDADVVAPGSCQVETWHARRGRDAEQTAVAPGCHFAGAEWSLFGLDARQDGERRRSVAVQGKWLLRAIEPGGLGVALVAGGGAESRAGRLSEVFAYLPLSIEPTDSLRVHLNLGGLLDRDARQWTATWGLGFDWALASRLHVLGERFGDGTGDSGWQLGLRPVLIEGRLHLDLVHGRNVDGIRGRWWTLGAVWAF